MVRDHCASLRETLLAAATAGMSGSPQTADDGDHHPDEHQARDENPTGRLSELVELDHVLPLYVYG